jgi:arylsulfatase
MMFHNAGMKGLKGSPDEGGVRVPFFVRWDGRIQPGRDVGRIAAHIDIFPTLAALANATVPPTQVEGRSLLPLIENPTADWPDRYLFTHQGRWKTGENPDDYQWQGFAVRNQRFRFVNNKALYDLEKDPGQATNVIDQHPDVVREMRAAYDAWWKDTRPLMVNEDVPMSPTRPYHVWFNRQQQEKGIPDWQEPEL